MALRETNPIRRSWEKLELRPQPQEQNIKKIYSKVNYLLSLNLESGKQLVGRKFRTQDNGKLAG